MDSSDFPSRKLPETATDRRLSRRWLFRSLALLLALLPFVALEVALRTLPGESHDAVDWNPVVDLHQYRPLFVKDADDERWHIPASRMNFFQPASFPIEKSANTRRIFVLGGSTVQGRPFSTETALSTWLQLRLQAARPDLRFEVINCGGVSYASYRVAKILEEVLQHQPDAIVIYTGHNEFLEEREYAEVRQLGPVRQVVARVAGSVETVRWLRQMWDRPTIKPQPLSGEVDTMLDHDGGLEKYRRDALLRNRVERHFAATLERMIEMTQQASVPLILCLPASDLVQTPPFKVAPAEDLSSDQLEAFQALWQRACSDNHTPEVRLAAAEKCLQIDPEHAGAHYLVGRLRYQRGEVAVARPHLIAARDFDVCPLRATTAILQAVEQLAREYEVPLVETTSLLDERDWQGRRRPDGIADPEYFVDHVHPNIAGHQRLGLALATQLAPRGWYPDGGESRSAGPVDFADLPAVQARYERLAQQHLATLGEAYYARGQQRLEGLRRWAAGRASIPIDEDETNDSSLPSVD